jgi:hypothetical protein
MLEPLAVRKTVPALLGPNHNEQEVKSWIATASAAELQELIHAAAKNMLTMGYMLPAQMALEEKLAKPPWSMTPLLIVAIITMVFAAIAAWPVLREWIPPSSSAALPSATPSPAISSPSPSP